MVSFPSAPDLFFYTHIYGFVISLSAHTYLQDLCSLNASVPCKQAQPNAHHQLDELPNGLFLLHIDLMSSVQPVVQLGELLLLAVRPEFFICQEARQCSGSPSN